MAFWGRRGVVGGLVAAFAAVAAGCDGTSGGGSGDPHVHPVPNEYGMGSRVHDVVGPATWFTPGNMNSLNCKSPLTVTQRLTGQVIVAVDRFDETGDGKVGTVYIEDVPTDGSDPPPYSGLEVFSPSYTPPDLRVFTGDVVDTFGQLEEFAGPSSGLFPECRTLPEFAANVAFRFENGPTKALTIVKAGTDPSRFDPIRGYANARQWLGMLVRIEGVQIPNAATCACMGSQSIDCTMCPANWIGRYQPDINIGGGVSANDTFTLSNELFDVRGKAPPTSAGAQFKAVTGIVTYFYGFHLAPRSADDFEL